MINEQELIEVMAEAIYNEYPIEMDCDMFTAYYSWKELSEKSRKKYIAQATAALKALCKVLPENKSTDIHDGVEIMEEVYNQLKAIGESDE